jgi:glutamine amidotransferase
MLVTSIALIDYGAGNLTSVRKGFAAAGVELSRPRTPLDLAGASAIVVPGVGHFRATSPLANGWRDAILEAVGRGVPLFGICLGLQWLFDSSEEADDVTGLGLMNGRCERLPGVVKVPHVGWNSLALIRPSRLFASVPEGSQVYFTHSYAAPVGADCVAVTTHGRPFAAAVERDNVFGVQFHPEKSGDIGLQVIRNFVATVGK